MSFLSAHIIRFMRPTKFRSPIFLALFCCNISKTFARDGLSTLECPIRYSISSNDNFCLYMLHFLRFTFFVPFSRFGRRFRHLALFHTSPMSCHLTSCHPHAWFTIVLTNIIDECTTHVRSITSLHVLHRVAQICHIPMRYDQWPPPTPH